MNFELLANTLFPNINITEQELEERFPPRRLAEGAIVSRMAPSPTGFVHLGNLVQGLTSERLTHQSGGVLFLRIEDTDAKREVAGAVETLIESLGHYNINFDEGATKDGDFGSYGPYRQRRRKEIYHVYAKKLVENGMAYPCFCTESELEQIHMEQEKAKANFGYFGKWALWRDRSYEEIKEKLDSGAPWVLRFRSNGSIENKFKFNDLIKGQMTLTENDIDYVLLKSDGIPTYHFAHVVDDHLMRTTHVVRGDEWISTLPFHIQLFNALGFKLPKYLHIGPLMKMDGSSKRKLSKRKDPELALTYYKSEGFPPESVYEYLMTILNSNFEDWRRANPDAPINDFKFSSKKMNPAGSLFDNAKLCDVSKNVISRMSAEKVYSSLVSWAEEFDADFSAKLKKDKEYAIKILSIGRGGKKPRKDITVWKDAKAYMGLFYDEYFVKTDDFPEQFDKNDIKNILNEYICSDIEAADNETWFEHLKRIAEKYGFSPDVKAYKASPELYKGHVGDVSTFIRIALTGKTNSPDLFEITKILGKERVIQRIKTQIAKLGQ